MWLVIWLETLAVSLLGSLLHFTYAWSKQNKFVAIFSAVNESTWEHIKLALSGLFACTLVDVWFLGTNPNYWLARSLSFLVPVVVIPILFYTYKALLKKFILPIDIVIFIIAAFLSCLTFGLVLEQPLINPYENFLSCIIGIIIMTMYLLLTRFPMKNFLFRDPITQKYGYDGHSGHHHHKHHKH